MIKKTLIFIFIGLCLIIGLYPLIYLAIDSSQGLLSTKSDELLNHILYKPAFYLHIFPGGISLLIGWIQFNNKIRINHPDRHRFIGKVYIIAAGISAIFGIAIGFFATGGWISSAGFISLGLVWLLTTLFGFKKITDNKIIAHQKLMILSYAMCFAAVTLRLWMPILIAVFDDFILSYKIVSWLCWIPNLLVGLYLTSKISPSEN